MSENLLSRLRHQTALFQTIVRQGVGHAERSVTHAELISLLRSRSSERISGAPGTPGRLDGIGQKLLAEGFRGVALYDRGGREIFRRGRVGEAPQIETDLGQTTLASLRWDGVLYLYTRVNIIDNGRIAGVLELEQPLTLIGEQLQSYLVLLLAIVAGGAMAVGGGEAHAIGFGSVELPGLHKDGTTIALELAINELRSGERRLFVGIVRDVTARKETERALRESEARFARFRRRSAKGCGCSTGTE